MPENESKTSAQLACLIRTGNNSNALSCSESAGGCLWRSCLSHCYLFRSWLLLGAFLCCFVPEWLLLGVPKQDSAAAAGLRALEKRVESVPVAVYEFLQAGGVPAAVTIITSEPVAPELRDAAISLLSAVARKQPQAMSLAFTYALLNFQMYTRQPSRANL